MNYLSSLQHFCNEPITSNTCIDFINTIPTDLWRETIPQNLFKQEGKTGCWSQEFVILEPYKFMIFLYKLYKIYQPIGIVHKKSSQVIWKSIRIPCIGVYNIKRQRSRFEHRLEYNQNTLIVHSKNITEQTYISFKEEYDEPPPPQRFGLYTIVEEEEEEEEEVVVQDDGVSYASVFTHCSV